MTEAEKIYKHTYFMIGETLVEESKQHITSEKACDKIREYLNEMRWKLNKESEQEWIVTETSAMSRNTMVAAVKNAWKMHRTTIAANLNVESMNFAEDVQGR